MDVSESQRQKTLDLVTHFSRPPITRLPLELRQKVIECLLPTGSITTHASFAEEPQLSVNFVESRKTLWAVCQTSRFLSNAARRYLYRIVTLRNTRELLCFFRTLTSDPEIRSLVRSFIWIGVLSSADPDYYSSDHLDKQLVQDCWKTLNWPVTADDVFLAYIMKLDGPDSFRGWNTLGAVLGMIPKVKSIFLPIGNTTEQGFIAEDRIFPPTSPEFFAIHRLFDPLPYTQDDREPKPLLRRGGWVARSPGSNRFLQEVETIFIEPSKDFVVRSYLSIATVRAFLFSVRSIRRIDIKGSAHWGERHLQVEKLPYVFENVREILHFETRAPQMYIPAIIATFPKLTKLAFESGNGSFHVQGSGPRQISCMACCEALLNLAETLESLQLTTTLGESWKAPVYPPLLSPTLSRMLALKHLVTECIWLFGRQNPSVALNLASMLPPSLVDLTIVDYWGVAELNSEIPRYYPDFPQHPSPLAFMREMLRNLWHTCPNDLPQLKTLTLTSPYFVSVETVTASAAVSVSGRLGFAAEFQQLFATRGVCFSVASREDIVDRLHDPWANS